MSWDGTLASGGIAKHGTPAHNNQGNPGTYAMPFAVTFDSAGAESAAYQTWSANPTYPANTYVLGSDSKLYKAVASNAANDPTTDDGTHWIRVSVPKGATAGGQVPIWDNTAKEYLPGNVSGTIAAGTTANNTLRWNGSAWVETGFLKNSDTQLTVNSPTSPLAGVPLVIKVANSAGLSIQDETATDSLSLSLVNTAQTNSPSIDVGVVGSNDSFVTGTTQGDSTIRQTHSGKRIFIGSRVNIGDSSATAIMVLDQTGVVIGGTSSAGAKLDVTAGSSQKGIRITGGNAPLLDIVNTAQACINITSSTALSSTSGASINICSNAASTGSGSRYGLINFGKNITGTTSGFASIDVISEEDNTTNIGVKMRLRVGKTGTTGTFWTAEIRGNGDFVPTATGSENATNATGQFVFLGTCNGTPTGVPANSYTGAVPVIIDRANNRLYAFIASAWTNLTNPSTIGTIQNKTANYTIAAGDSYITGDTTSGNFSVTLPDATANQGRIIWIKNIASANNLTVNLATSTDKMQGTVNGTQVLTGVAGQTGGKGAWVANGTDWQRIAS